MNLSRNSFEMMCFSRFIILQRCGYAIFICSKSCKLLQITTKQPENLAKQGIPGQNKEKQNHD